MHQPLLEIAQSLILVLVLVYFLAILSVLKDTNYMTYLNIVFFVSRDVIFHEAIFPYLQNKLHLFLLPFQIRMLQVFFLQ
jgi:hypothetical protein